MKKAKKRKVELRKSTLLLPRMHVSAHSLLLFILQRVQMFTLTLGNCVTVTISL